MPTFLQKAVMQVGSLRWALGAEHQSNLLFGLLGSAEIMAKVIIMYLEKQKNNTGQRCITNFASNNPWMSGVICKRKKLIRKKHKSSILYMLLYEIPSHV